MNSHAKRLVQLINQLNLNTRSFAITCGFSQPTTIYSVIKNNSKLTTSTLNKICDRFPQVNKDWLLSGLGEMFVNSKANEDELTVTAKQVNNKINISTDKILNTIVPKMLRHDLITKADNVLDELSGFLNEFKLMKTDLYKIKKDISKINDNLTNIEFIETVKVIKKQNKKDNGGIDLN
jgi:hypothetical protein